MAPQPSGTVTLLFTDIEGSTRLWEQHESLMRAALARHDTVLRGGIERRGGYVFKTVGDAFCAAFATACDALEAALDCQRVLHDLRALPASAEVPIAVRMALHTGAVEVRDGDYFGPPLNRVARLLAAGHGGQILLSLATAELVRDQLPVGVILTDLGEHRLRDLQRPERAFQVTHGALPSSFPPLRSLDYRPNNLPVQGTPFVGREAEVGAVKERLLRDDVRLLTLTGPGGTGKTRLALQVAAEAMDAFADGVFFVPLEPVSEAERVAPAIATALGVREATAGTPRELLRGQLRNKQVLLVLDNFEQVLSGAGVVAELLAECPRLKVLVTSREALRLSAEHEYSVPPLSVPPRAWAPGRGTLGLEALTQYEAVRLFVERARAVKPDFQVTNENAPAVAEICVRLDGLPLAIELAAARVKLLPPHTLLARLESRLRVLTGGARDLPVRQQTLRGAIEWSHMLLDAHEQALFRRLSVFAGGGTLPAVEAICGDGAHAGDTGDPGDVLDRLSSLVDKSLVRQMVTEDGEPRFTMLETIREYARERLEAGDEARRVRERHAVFFETLARQAEPELRGAAQRPWMDRLEADHDNLRAALDWLAECGDVNDVNRALAMGGALWRFWWIRGHLREGCERLGGLLAMPRATTRTNERAEALFGAGVLLAITGTYEAARERFEESRSIWQELGDEAGVAYVLLNFGELEGVRGELAAALDMLEQSAAIFRRLNDRRGQAWVAMGAGYYHHLKGDSETARAVLREGARQFRELGEEAGLAHTLSIMAAVEDDLGQLDEAGALYGEALELQRALGDPNVVVMSLSGVASLAARRGELERAAHLDGATAKLQQEGSIRWLYILGDRLEPWRAILPERLGAATYRAAVEAGRRMTPEETIEFALAGLPPLGAGRAGAGAAPSLIAGAT